MGKPRSLCGQENGILASSQCKDIHVTRIIKLNQVYFARQWFIGPYSQNIHFLQKQEILLQENQLEMWDAISSAVVSHGLSACYFRTRDCQEFCVLITWAFMGHECTSLRSPENLKLQKAPMKMRKIFPCFLYAIHSFMLRLIPGLIITELRTFPF